MGAGPWLLYTPARGHLADGGFDLDSDSFKMSLYRAASNAADVRHTAIEELTGEVASGAGYVAGGQALTGVSWALTPNPSKVRFSANAASWSASGGTIIGVRYAVIWRPKPGANLLLLVAAVDENAEIDVPSGNALVVAPNTQGIFELASVGPPIQRSVVAPAKANLTLTPTAPNRSP
jgi:hypothetical protein